MIDPFKKQQIEELRVRIGRIPPFKTKRQSFTRKQRADVFAAYGGLCAGCDDTLRAGWEVDHIRRLADEGKHEPSNWQALCRACHRDKTAAERHRDAKADMCRKKDLAADRQPSALVSRPGFPPSRGFDTRLSKGLNGKVTARKSRPRKVGT